jgi:uncharacterized protein (DUF433 family)
MTTARGKEKLDGRASPFQVDLNQYIERHIFEDRRTAVAAIVYAARSEKWDVRELMYQYTLNCEEIDAQKKAYQAELDEMYGFYGTKLPSQSNREILR